MVTETENKGLEYFFSEYRIHSRSKGKGKGHPATRPR